MGSSGGVTRAGWSGACALIAVVCLAMMAGPASAQSEPSPTPLPVTAQPLPGSTFQGGDGNQDAENGFEDWQSLSGVHHHSDANHPDSSFAGGSKDSNPGEWDLTTSNNGVSPGTDNIRDVWAKVDERLAGTFLYAAFSRDDGGGTTHLAFELNRDGELWNNGHADIPCRRTDDLLITYETHGNEPYVQVRRWITDHADAITDCARTGHFGHPVGVIPSPEDDANVQGQLNAAAIPSRLGGAFHPTVPARQFGEVSLNLTDIALKVFGDRCLAYSSIWMHSRASRPLDSAMKDFVAPMSLPVRSCSASGTKFWDANANGVRDPGEPGLPRWLIWADYNDNGIHDRLEPFAITDDHGHWVIFGIRPPLVGGVRRYWLRETLLPQRRPRRIPLDWVCSAPSTTATDGRFPCAFGPFDIAQTPDVTGREFGNWFPAQLTLEKFVFPPTGDPGSWDLLVEPPSGRVELPQAVNGSSRTIALPPGTYSVSERPTAGTNPADYLEPQVDCQTDVSRRGGRRSGAVFENLELVAGAHARCTFTNVRLGEPAIAIRKSGPAVATAGHRLHYRLVVSNPGALPIPAESVHVRDSACDGTPELVEKRTGSGPDRSPETLDPRVDEWEYACTRRTAAPGASCHTRTVDNTATVTGTAAGKEVTASDTVSTILVCPDQPPPPPLPDRPGPITPPGPRPPEAGVAGQASFLRPTTRRCITTRSPRLHIRGTRMASISIFVNGHLRRRVTVAALQRRVRPRVSLTPGRHRVTLRVVFQRGSGTPPVTLSRIVTICEPRPPAPQFTG